MILNELLTRQNVITKIELKDNDKELSKELKVKIMRIRLAYNKVKKAFDEDVKEFVEQMTTDEYKELVQKTDRNEDEEKRFNELTTKIKEYDNKIAELDKMLKDMETLKTKSEKKKQEEKIEEVIETNFLKGNKIKVVYEEETKNKKKTNPKTIKPIKEKAEIKQKNVEITLKPIVEKQITETSNKKKNQLNLDPKDIKKINRPSKGKLPIDELIEKQNTKPLKKKKTVKYIKPSEIKTKKKPIISIEKVRK